MKLHRKVDKSLTARHGILHLLEKLGDEGTTAGDLEEIGAKLRTAGRQALPPLVRKLWREKNPDLIAKYAYLLDFLDDDSCIDHLVQIALKRRDLEDEGKAALSAALEGYGVDVTVPPLATCLSPRGGASLYTTLPRLLDKGDEGLIVFMEDFFLESQDKRLAIIRKLPGLSGLRALPLMETLLGIEDREIRVETLTALGKVRSSSAASIVLKLIDDEDGEVREAAQRSLRRLGFLGIQPEPSCPPTVLPAFHSAYASPFDSAGVRAVWISRKCGDLITALYLQLHDQEGVRAAWGCAGITAGEFDRYLAETSCDDGIVEVPPGYARALVQDALACSTESGALLPAEFYVWRRIFTPEELAPQRYHPSFNGFDLGSLAGSTGHITASGALLDDDFFTGWLLTCGHVYDLAAEWNELDKHTGSRHKGRNAIMERFYRELLIPDIERLKRRLVLTADLMRVTGREREIVEQTLAAALSIDDPRFESRHHPFLSRLAKESVLLACEALAEGYDPRGYEEDEWE